MLLRNPQLLGNLGNQGIAQQFQQIAQSVQAQDQARATAGNAAMQAFNAMANLNAPLAELAQLGQVQNQLANAYVEQIAALEQVAQLGFVQKDLANHYLEQLTAAEEMIGVLEQMLSNPIFLIGHAFDVWLTHVQAEDEAFVSIISDLYMKLVSSFEEKFKQQSGQYTPTYTQYLQSQVNSPFPGQGIVNPIPPQSQQAQQQTLSALKQFAEGLNKRGFGQELQRQHAMLRQQVG